MNISRTNIVLIVIAIVILAAAAYLLFGKSEPGAALTTEAASASEAEIAFISLTSKIDTVDFDTSILQDPRFMGLRDIRVPVTAEPANRPDPFAPFAPGGGQ